MIRQIIYTFCALLFCTAVIAQPKAEFENKTIDFGTVVEGTICKHSFKFKNIGNKPLEISDVSVTCGCTVPRWAHQPILPGDTSSVYVEFNTFNKMGSVAKGVNLKTNCPDPEIGLIILAKIIPDSNYKVIVDSIHYKPLRLLDQKAYSQVTLPVKNLSKRKFRGDGTDLEILVKRILSEKDSKLAGNVWYTTTLDAMVVNTYSREDRILLAQILSKEFSKKRKIKYWQKKVKGG